MPLAKTAMVARRSCSRMLLFAAAKDLGRSLMDRLAFCRMRHSRSWKPDANIARLCEEGLLHEALQSIINLTASSVRPQNLSFLLLECIRTKNLTVGRQVQALMVEWQFEQDSYLASHLIHLFSICGSLSDSYQVFCKASSANLYIWTAIISAFVQNERRKEAIHLYQEMKQSSVRPNDYTYVSVLKACNCPAFLEEGQLIHGDIIKAGHEGNLYVENTLIDMYSKCGSLDRMRQVFDGLQERDLISWNVVIEGYSQHRFSHHALQLFMQMQQESILPDTFTFVSVLKACGSEDALYQGKLLHSHLVSCDLVSNMFIRNVLVGMYAKGGDLDEARQLFDSILEKDIVVWNTMMTAYAQKGQSYDVFQLFDGMKIEGIKPNCITFGILLNACSSAVSIDKGESIHKQIFKAGLESNVFAGSALVDMYVKCGNLEKARQAFDKLQNKDVVSWNIMIAGYAQNGHGLLALDLFNQMEKDGMKPNSVTFLSLLRACISVQSVDIAKSIHKKILDSEAAADVFVGNALVDMYAKCGDVDEAYRIFNMLPKKDVVTWNAMIHGYVMHELPQQALELFGQMLKEHVKPNSATILGALKACGGIKAIAKGRSIHKTFINVDDLSNVLVGSALIDMYCKCNSISEAREVFDSVPVKNLALWNAMILGCSQLGYNEQALQLFKEMQMLGMDPDLITFGSILKSCANLDDIDQVRLVHDQLRKSGTEMDASIWNTLIDSYAKCGSLDEAANVFTSLSRRSVFSWNAIIGAYVKYGLVHKAITLYEEMMHVKVEPDAVTFATILKACGSTTAIEYGKQLHTKVHEKGLDGNLYVGNALVDMYAKCGCVEEAFKVFENLKDKDVVSWNAMLSGYARHGLGLQAIKLFKEMDIQGIKADHATFVSVLSACSCMNLLDEGLKILKSMVEDHGIVPTAQHHSCIVDLLSRAGKLCEAENFIKKLAA